MKNKRRSADRRRSKGLAKKDREKRGNQERKETLEPDEPKRKDSLRFGIDIGVRLLSPFLRDIADKVIDFLDKVKDFLE